MKTIMLILIALASPQLFAKTCTATLNGKLLPREFVYASTKVLYPDLVWRSGIWQGAVVTKKFIPPEPIEIECGKPFFQGKFGKFRATGMLPPSILTEGWTAITTMGPKPVPPEVMYGFGDSSDYPYPATYFEGTNEEIVIDEPAPAGVKDVCDVTKLPLSSIVKESTQITPDASAVYSQPSEYGPSYTWDRFSTPANEIVELELEDPYIMISCDAEWKFEATFKWPYVIPADHDSLCGPGEVHREMKMSGNFSVDKDNKISGILKVEKPTVSYSGTITAAYYGTGFSIPLDGKLDEKTVKMPLFYGGDGISWTYTLMCPYGNISNNLFGAASNYLQIMMDQEEVDYDDEIGGFFKMNADGDEKTFNVDMRGQGQVTIEQSWKKIK